uniref:Uncharacterized protein n=1 Tax=viral metagenome TaxID=1070528 RepID=A0A6C0K0N8_9ZZZZ
MSLMNHTDKIVFLKDYLIAEDREYLLIYGSAASGKFYIVKQAYNILDDTSKSSLYLTVIYKDAPIHYGDKTASKRKTILIRETLDSIAMNYINGWSAEVKEFIPDPIHTLHTIYNYDVELRKWLRVLKTDSTDIGSPVLDLIPLREEFLKVNYDRSVADTVVYDYGLKGQEASVTFTVSTIQFGGFSKLYSRS